MRKILIPAILFGAWQLSRVARAANLLEYYPKNIKIEGKKIKDLKIFLVMDVVNPTNKSLDFNAIFAKVLVNGQQVGRIEYNQKTTIQALATSTINVPIILTPEGAGILAANVLTGKKQSIQVDGLITSGRIQVPFNYNSTK